MREIASNLCVLCLLQPVAMSVQVRRTIARVRVSRSIQLCFTPPGRALVPHRTLSDPRCLGRPTAAAETALLAVAIRDSDPSRWHAPDRDCPVCCEPPAVELQSTIVLEA